MKVGETVVLVRDIEGIETGRHGRVMGLCDDTVMVGCRMRERLPWFWCAHGMYCRNRCGADC